MVLFDIGYFSANVMFRLCGVQTTGCEIRLLQCGGEI